MKKNNIFKILILSIILGVSFTFSCFAEDINVLCGVGDYLWIKNNNGWWLASKNNTPNTASWTIKPNDGNYYQAADGTLQPFTSDTNCYYYNNSAGAVEVNSRWYIFDTNGYLTGEEYGYPDEASAVEAIAPIVNADVEHTRTASGGNKLTKPFSTLHDQLGTDIENNFDFFGIGITTMDFVNTPGNKEFINDDTLVNNFKSVLTAAKYDTTEFDKLIDYLKSVAEFALYKMQEKKFMEYKPVAIDARTQKEYNIKIQIGADIIETIFKTIGLLLVFYAFIIAIAGVIDETGSIDKGLVGILTAGKLNRENNPSWNKDGHVDEGKAFRLSYLAVAALLCLLGIICISPTTRGFISDKLMWIINGIKDIFHIG